MVMDHNTHDHAANSDARLNAAMTGWQAPALPPGFTARVAASITTQQAEQQARRETLLPWSPLKLSAATAAAVMVGLALGVTAPVVETTDATDAAELTSIETVVETVGAPLATLTATADTTEIIEQLW
jgi:hypothetical protein